MSRHRNRKKQQEQKPRQLEQRPPKPEQQALPKTVGLADASVLGSLKREWDEAFTISKSRSERLSDFAVMDQGIIATMLTDLVSACLTFDGNTNVTDDILNFADAFKIQCEGYSTSGPKQVMRQVLEDTNLRRLCRFALRDTIKNADDFWEPLVDGGGNLVRLFPHRAADIIVNWTEKGDLTPGVDTNGFPMAYQQRTSVGSVIAGWHEHEFIHLRYWPNPKFRYSEFGFLDSYRDLYHKLKWIEESLVVTRVSRAAPRLAWRIDLTGKSAEEGKKVMRNFVSAITRRETPSGMMTKTLNPDDDYFYGTGYRTGSDSKMYPLLTGVDLLDPRLDGLANIADIQHLRQGLFSQVPSEMLGIYQQRGQDLTAQEIAMRSLLQYLQVEVLERQFIRPVIDMALRLRGYAIPPYKVVWPSGAAGAQSWKWADAQFRMALGFKVELDSQTMSRQEYLKRKYGYSDDEVQEVLRQAEEEVKRFGLTNPKDTSGQMAVGNTSASLDPRDDSISEAERLTRLVNT